MADQQLVQFQFWGRVGGKPLMKIVLNYGAEKITALKRSHNKIVKCAVNKVEKSAALASKIVDPCVQYFRDPLATLDQKALLTLDWAEIHAPVINMTPDQIKIHTTELYQQKIVGPVVNAKDKVSSVITSTTVTIQETATKAVTKYVPEKYVTLAGEKTNSIVVEIIGFVDKYAPQDPSYPQGNIAELPTLGQKVDLLRKKSAATAAYRTNGFLKSVRDLVTENYIKPGQAIYDGFVNTLCDLPQYLPSFKFSMKANVERLRKPSSSTPESAASKEQLSEQESTPKPIASKEHLSEPAPTQQ